VILWNTATGEPIGLPLSEHTKVVNAVAFGVVKNTDGGDAPYLLSGSDDKTVIKWDLSTRTRKPLSQPLKEISSPPEVGVSTVSGSLEASVLDEQKIQLSNRTEPLTGHTGAINDLSFSPQIDGKLLLASASDDQTVILWDVSEGATEDVFLKLEGFDDPVGEVYFDGGQLITVEKGKDDEEYGRSIRWNITPSDWLSLACDAANRNLSMDEWKNYFSTKDYQKTCEANP
jgi:WD40 repeat protein